jgi:SAM-dependent methyltransferase
VTGNPGHPLREESSTPHVLGDSPLQSRTLEEVAAAHNYHDWLTSLALPHLGDDPLELGSGLGDYAARWRDAGVPRITVTDADPDRLGALRARFAGDPQVSVRFLDLPDAGTAGHSALVMFNVLEHIPDDVGVLQAAHSLVRPGGTVVVFVPAFDFAMSRFDRVIGHVRRYTKDSLRRVLDTGGLEIEELRYVNLPGLPAWFVGMRLLGMTPGEGRMLQYWDRFVVPRARRWEARHRPPFGQSVFAVARVPGG